MTPVCPLLSQDSWSPCTPLPYFGLDGYVCFPSSFLSFPPCLAHCTDSESQPRQAAAMLGCCSPSRLLPRGLCPLKGWVWPVPSPTRHGFDELPSLRGSFYLPSQTVAIHASGHNRCTESSVEGARASLTRTAALHGAVGSRVAFGACDVTSPFVQIQTFLTFCAKVSTETGLTVLNFAFWGNIKHTQKNRHVTRGEQKPQEACDC